MNVREILTHLGIQFRDHGQSSHVTPGWVGIVCPSPGCGQGGKFGRGINLRTFKTTCWKCGPARLGDVLALASGRPLGEILALLPRLARDNETAPERPKGRYKAPEGVGALNTAHRRYLASRGFDPDEIAAVWGVGGIGDGGRLAWRLFIPVFASQGGKRKPVTWTTRAVGKREPRYLAAPPTDEDKPIHSVLYGAHLAKHAVVVVEGPTDAWAVGPGAVCTFGLVVTPPQAAAIAKYPVRVIAFDNEPAAQRKAARLASDLGVFPGATYVAMTSGKDPATSPKEELAELRNFLA